MKKLTNEEALEKIRRCVKEGKVVFAEGKETDRQKYHVDHLLRVIAALFYCDDPEDVDTWMRYCFVSDLSTLGDFLHEEGNYEQLGKQLGFEVFSRDYIYEVAMRMGKTQ